MNTRKLSSFNGDKGVQVIQYDRINEWLDYQMRPKTAMEIAKEVMATRRVIKPSDCVLENEELFTTELQLPLWLFQLLITINHHNSKGFYGLTSTYETTFYGKFIFACNVGVDYSLCYHKWEAFLLKELIPESLSDNAAIAETIDLHEKVLSGNIVSKEQWEKLFCKIEAEINSLNNFEGDSAKELLWTMNRAVLLSIAYIVYPNEHYPSSLEAVIDICYQEFFMREKSAPADNKKKIVYKTFLWHNAMDDLLSLLYEWK